MARLPEVAVAPAAKLVPLTGVVPALTLGFVGSGRAASALARDFRRIGHRVLIAERGESATRLAREQDLELSLAADLLAASDLTFLAVPDDLVGEVAAELAATAPDGGGRVVAHLAGSLGLEALEPLARRGYIAAAVHPLQVLSGWRIPPGTTFAVEAPQEARPIISRLVQDLGGVELELPPTSRSTYHAAAVIAANLGMTLLAEAVDILEAAGIDRRRGLQGLAGLVRGGLEASVDRGLPAALTGPIARGDVTTVRAHLEVLETNPKLRDAYRAVALLALRQVRREERPSAAAAAALTQLLEEKP